MLESRMIAGWYGNPERKGVQTREGHIAAPISKRHDIVHEGGNADQDADDHDDPVQGHERVVFDGTQELQAGFRQLRTEDQGE